MILYLHQLLLFYVKHDTFPNLLGAHIQYMEEYYNFSERYFFLFSNNNESVYYIKPKTVIRPFYVSFL